MGQASIRSLVQHLVRGPDFVPFTVWGGGVQRSELARSGLRMFDAEWANRGERRPNSHDDRLSDRQALVARAVLQGLAEPLLLVAAISADLLTRVGEDCERARIAVSLDQISGRCTSAATAHVRRHWRAATVEELAEAARRITANVSETLPRRWSAEKFVAHFAPVYDEQWRCRGELNLAAYPPSRLLLGHDARPPLTRPGARETDACGTDRSVYSRYASYRPPAPGQRVPFRSRAERCIQPVSLRSTSRDLATEEIHRACLPYGLDQQVHRVVLRGTHHGLLFDGQGAGSPVGEDVSGRCLSLGRADEVDIAETVRRILQRHIPRRSRAAAATRAVLDVEGVHWAVDGMDPSLLAGHLDRVTRIVTRRLWKALHGLELYVEEHICSCTLQAVVSVALDRAVPAARMSWDDDGREAAWPAMASENPEAASNREAAALLEAQNRTCELLMRHPDVSTALLTLQPGWQAGYQELVAAAPYEHLSADEFEQWCRDVVPADQIPDEEAP